MEYYNTAIRNVTNTSIAHMANDYTREGKFDSSSAHVRQKNIIKNTE